jgi:hypothetical protein
MELALSKINRSCLPDPSPKKTHFSRLKIQLLILLSLDQIGNSSVKKGFPNKNDDLILQEIERKDFFWSAPAFCIRFPFL